MSEKNLKLYKKLLLKEKERIEDLGKSMENDMGHSSIEAYGVELSSYDNHPGDYGTEMFMREHEMGLKDKNSDLIFEIETSLNKIEDGSFGICEICGKEIDDDRLKILPYTKLCIECSKERIPLDRKMSFRPEEESSRYPFGRNYIDELKRDEVEFDREDSYQAVARYNKVPGDPSFATGDDVGIYDDNEEGIVEDVEKISQDYYDDTL